MHYLVEWANKTEAWKDALSTSAKDKQSLKLEDRFGNVYQSAERGSKFVRNIQGSRNAVKIAWGETSDLYLASGTQMILAAGQNMASNFSDLAKAFPQGKMPQQSPPKRLTIAFLWRRTVMKKRQGFNENRYTPVDMKRAWGGALEDAKKDGKHLDEEKEFYETFLPTKASNE